MGDSVRLTHHAIDRWEEIYDVPVEDGIVDALERGREISATLAAQVLGRRTVDSASTYTVTPDRRGILVERDGAILTVLRLRPRQMAVLAWAATEVRPAKVLKRPPLTLLQVARWLLVNSRQSPERDECLRLVSEWMRAENVEAPPELSKKKKLAQKRCRMTLRAWRVHRGRINVRGERGLIAYDERGRAFDPATKRKVRAIDVVEG